MKIADILTEKSQAERKRELNIEHDQWFTQPAVAAQLAQFVKNQPFFKDVTRIIEPAAGNGEIAQHFPGVEAYDIEPQSENIQQADFLKSNFKRQHGTLVVMNPPFGKRSNLVVQFFNKAATFADYIAMIGPSTVRRPVISNQLNNQFHLVAEYGLPPNSFYWPAEGGAKHPVNVPAVAQIWVRGQSPRAKTKSDTTTQHFEWATKDTANIAVRRLGTIGSIIIDREAIRNLSPNVWYFLRGDSNVVAALKAINWKKYGQDNIGAPSITKSELVSAVNNYFSR